MATKPTTPAVPATFQPCVPATQSPPSSRRSDRHRRAVRIALRRIDRVLGLRAGLTVSASIPIAVLAISVCIERLGGSTILENNIVQTIGSAGESVAAGVVFTVPALIFLTPHGPQ